MLSLHYSSALLQLADIFRKMVVPSFNALSFVAAMRRRVEVIWFCWLVTLTFLGPT